GGGRSEGRAGRLGGQRSTGADADIAAGSRIGEERNPLREGRRCAIHRTGSGPHNAVVEDTEAAADRRFSVAERIAALPPHRGSQAKPNRGAKLCQLLAHHFVEGCTVTLSAAPAVLNTLAGVRIPCCLSCS